MRNFRTYQLAVDFYRQAATIKLGYALKDKLTRAASSIALNLAEGRGKATVKDQKRFFSIALGSVRECQAILDLALKKQTKEWATLDTLGGHVYQLIKCAV